MIGVGVGISALAAHPNTFGPELVVNGDFSNGTTGWGTRYSALFSVASEQGRVEIASAQTTGRISRSITCVVGKTYEISAMVWRQAAGSPYLKVSTLSSLDSAILNTSPPALNANHISRGRFVATATTIWIGPSIDGVAGNFGLFDVVSVKEVLRS